MQIKFWSGVLFLALMGCQSSGPVRVSVPFDEVKARALLKPGTNQVTGRIMVAMASGTLVTCRDVAHRRLIELGRELPVNPRAAVAGALASLSVKGREGRDRLPPGVERVLGA